MKAPQKLLAGIGVVTLIGSAALGFLIFKNSGALQEARGNFEKTATVYQSLRGQALYPSAENLKKLEGERDSAGNAALEALKELSPIVIPLEEISPEQFQDKLRQMVNTITQKADERKVLLPDDFYLGFDGYKNQAPLPTAAPVLWRQLRAVELAVNILLDSRIDSITSLDRVPLPEEGGKPSAKTLVANFPFTLEFVTSQAALRRSLNDITSSKEQFFVPRKLVVKNQGDKPLAKGDDKPGSPGAAASSVKGDSAAKSALQYLVGIEKLNVTLNLEMVVFSESFGK